MPRAKPATARLPRGSLDRARVLGAAWEVCAERGVAGLTMQAVATHLGVRSTAVHWHFPQRQVLVDALFADAVERFNLLLPGPDERPWHEQTRHYWESFRRILREDRALCDLIVGEWTAAARVPHVLVQTYRRIDTQLGLLVGAGFTPEAAARAYHLLSTYTRGCLLNERMAGNAAGLTRGVPRSSLGADLTWLPHFRAAAPYWTFTFATDEDFAYGLDAIIGGLRAELDRGQPVRRRARAGRR